MFHIISKDQEKIKFSEILDFLAKSTAALLIIFGVASIAYEYMYFWTIGQEYIVMFSPSDFVKLTIYWLPSSVIISVVVLGFFYPEFRDKLNAYQAEGNAGLVRWEKSDRIGSYFYFAAIIIFVLSIPFMSWKNINPIRHLTAALVSMIIIRQIASGRLPLTNRPLDTLFFYLFIVYIWISALFSGLDAGIRDAERRTPVQTVQTVDGEFKLVFLRSIDKGMIFINPDKNSILFIPWGQIKKYESHVAEISDLSIYDKIRSYISQFKSK